MSTKQQVSFRTDVAPARYEALWRETDGAGLDALVLVARAAAGSRGPMRFVADWHLNYVHNAVYAVVVKDEPPLIVANHARQARTVKERAGLNAELDTNTGEALRAALERTVGSSGRVGIAPMNAIMPVEEYLYVKDALPGIEIVDATDTWEAARMVKSAADLDAARESYRILKESYAKLVEVAGAGVSESEIQAEVEYVYRRSGVYDFNTLMGSGPTFYWGPPGSRSLEQGDLITFLFEFAGPRGFWVERTVVGSVGEPAADVRRLYDVCLAAKDEAAAVMKAGNRACDVVLRGKEYVAEVAPELIVDDWMGHALGLDTIEAPDMTPADETVLQEGMLISLHPRFFLPDRSNTISVGDTYVVGTDGAELLVEFPHELFVV